MNVNKPMPAAHSRFTYLLHGLASPRWMLAFFLFAAISALISMEYPEWITTVWILPLLLFSISLLAAMATNSRLQHDMSLLGLHLGLLFFIGLVVFARLTYLDGAVSLDRGSNFDGHLHTERRGSWHFGDLSQVRFANDGFTETFLEGERWQMTTARVRWWDKAGQSHTSLIGDHHPLILEGYHIYTTTRRGYSAVFHWHGDAGSEEIGKVQLRTGEHDQANDWQLPGGPALWAMLLAEESTTLKPGATRESHAPYQLRHQLVIRYGEQRKLINIGETLDLPGGRLTYRSLDSWMGYRFVFDPAMHWLTAGAFSVLCMIFFYGRQILGRR